MYREGFMGVPKDSILRHRDDSLYETLKGI